MGLIALGLALLTACAPMLEREYTEVSPHVEDPPPHAGAAYRVESYPALRSALLSYVEEGMAEGLLRFPTTYPGDLSVDMEKARRQLLEEEPLGCYALAEMDYRTSKIIAYYEVELRFTYQVEPESLKAIPRAVSRPELLTLLRQGLERGEERMCLYLTAYPEGDEGYLRTAVAEAWQELQSRSAPPEGSEGPEGTAPEEPEETPPPPELETELYPQTGTRRVAVLRLTYAGAEEAGAA